MIAWIDDYIPQKSHNITDPWHDFDLTFLEKESTSKYHRIILSGTIQFDNSVDWRNELA